MTTQLPSKYLWKSSREPLGVRKPQVDNHWHQWRTQKIFMGGFHAVAYGGHLYWCALFVTSQFEFIFMFPNQRFGEVC